MMHKTKIDIGEDIREEMIRALNSRLADSIDLKSQAKQAHWNVKGMSFIALHELFDQVAAEVEAYTDVLAERITVLGGTAEGTVRVAAEKSSLSQYPMEITDGADHVNALSNSLAKFAENTRANVDDADKAGDKITADLFTEVARGTDKLLWFVEAHSQA